MTTLHSKFTGVLALFAPHFSREVWQHVQVLVFGAILCRGQRTVTAVLRVMGYENERCFANYHRVLNRAKWSAHALARTLLNVLVNTFVAEGELLIGGDETIERRRGGQIKAKGIYRDPVRSSRSHFVKTSGLRWITIMLLAPIPFAERIWALPIMTLLAPSARFYAGRRSHKTITDWMRQALLQLRRWLPKRKIVFVADSTYAVLSLLERMCRLSNPITMVVRFRMDARLFEPAPVRKPGTRGRPPKVGQRLPTLTQIAADPATLWVKHIFNNWYGEAMREIEIASGTAVWYHSGEGLVPLRWVILRDPLGRFKTQSLLCTDVAATPLQIVLWFIQRWQMEVTHREVREHLGVETQRQWSDKAIARTTPALFGLYSLIAVLAHHIQQSGHMPTRRSAWYDKPRPTFSDALAAVRLAIWRIPGFCTGPSAYDIQKLPDALFTRVAHALCYAS